LIKNTLVNSANFWLDQQGDFDLEEKATAKKSAINSIKSYQGNAA
jgi:plasmid maintenance system antidote protein VapI